MKNNDIIKFNWISKIYKIIKSSFIIKFKKDLKKCVIKINNEKKKSKFRKIEILKIKCNLCENIIIVNYEILFIIKNHFQWSFY